MEYFAENNRDMICETLASFEERQAENGYRQEVRESFYQGYFLGVDYIVIEAILRNADWKQTKFLDVMCGDGYRTSRLFSEMEEIESLDRRNFGQTMRTLVQMGDNSTSSLFRRVKGKYDLHGIDGSEVMLKYAKASGIYRTITHARLPCLGLGLRSGISSFNYCFVLGASFGHICGKDGNEIRIDLLREIKKKILPEGVLLLDFCYCNWTFIKDSPAEKVKNVYRKKSFNIQKNNTYVRIFGCEEFKNLAEQSGFEVRWLKGVLLEFGDRNRPLIRLVDIYNSLNKRLDISVLSGFPFALIVSLCVPMGE